jgi:hypothetical protein
MYIIIKIYFREKRKHFYNGRISSPPNDHWIEGAKD